MCGIAGVLSSKSDNGEALERRASLMATCLAHRGPDDHGTWSDPDAGVALAHRRLSIVDLSPAGHQPMVSADGRFVIIFNGEIYNHLEIRSELEARGICFRGNSDTEVMLEAIAAYGIATTVKRLIGMFAIGVWDRRDRTLTLVRDRLGIKPLYWTKSSNCFLFGSELKSLRAYPGWTPRINDSAIAAFMRLSYIPAPHTIYQDVYKLEPGCILTLPYNDEPRIERYWDARSVALSGLANQAQESDAELTDELEALLQDAVRRRMIADVPLGAFLSGGVDSSTVAALMQTANMGKVRTFNIGFGELSFDESRHAAAVAKHLGTDHTEMTVGAQQALDVIPNLADMYDEPFADSSQIPTHLVSAMTRRHVTVALSGDGGDEVFAGYNRYKFARNPWQMVMRLPHPLRAGAARVMVSMSPSRWDALAAALPSRMRPPQFGEKIHKLAAILGTQDNTAIYRCLVTHGEPSDLMPAIAEAIGALWDDTITQQFSNALDRMQFLDLVTYLPDDILIKVDRASMAVGLEARVPILDHRVVEFAWRLPQRAKFRNGQSKYLLRQVLYRRIPAKLIERPKMGFAVPLAQWLRGPLRDWAETLLSEKRLHDAGVLDAPYVRRIWSEHLSGRSDFQHVLWNCLMLEAWRERWG